MEKLKFKIPEAKVKVYEFDFGDQNLITENFQDILDWLKSDFHDMKTKEEYGNEDLDLDDEISFTVKTYTMTRKEVDELPDWGN